MTFISYAQNFEDVMLFRALRDVEKGFYIDVGAQDPIIDSVTRAFYEQGWRGINIEPSDEYYQKLLVDRPEDINLKLLASSNIGELPFHEFLHTGLSTTRDEYALKHQQAGFEGQVAMAPCSTLDEICKVNNIHEVHFLKIDVEGGEREVLKGFSFKDVRPWILLIEAVAPVIIGDDTNSLTVENTSFEWEQLVLANGYESVYFDGLNSFFIAKEHAGLIASFKAPPNVFDNYVTYPLWYSQQELKRINAVLKTKNNEKRKLTNTLKHADAEQERLKGLLERYDNEKEKLTEAFQHTNAEKSRLIGLLEQSDIEKGQLITELECTQATLTEQKAHMQWLQNECDAAKEKIDELNHSSHHWWTVAEDLNQELQTIYNSKSWRITWPLRKLMQLFKWLLYLPIRITLWLIRLPKRTIRWLLVKVMAFALKHRGIKLRAIAWLHKYPRLNVRLRLLAQAHGLVANRPPIRVQPDQVQVTIGNEASTRADLSHLTPRARRIYEELKAAMAQHQKENG